MMQKVSAGEFTNKFQMGLIGRDVGLSESAIKTFERLSDDTEFMLEVNDETGESRIAQVNGKDVSE